VLCGTPIRSFGTAVADLINMRQTSRNIAALVLMGLASCDTATGTQPEKDLWLALGIQNYDFVFQISCFCGIQGPNPAKLSVRDGAVTKVESADSTMSVGVTPPLSSYPTVDSLFAILERAQKATPAGVTVEFDPTYHYPSRIFIDPIKNAADDETTYTVQKFTPVIVPGSG
jgi:hypothetical protein